MSLQHKANMLGLYVEHFGGLLEDVKSDPQVAKCLGSIIASTPIYTDAVVRSARYGALSWAAWHTAAGSLAATAINTNKDPSAGKTILTTILGSIVGDFASSGDLTLALFGPRDILALKDECLIHRRQMESLKFDISVLTSAQREELAKALNLTSAQLSKFIADLDTALADAESGLKVCAAVLLTIMTLSGYHGYKRSGGLSALGFFLAGATGLGVAIKQGYAKPLPTE
jgi:hypothetical protein